jgi:hypothetical protein
VEEGEEGEAGAALMRGAAAMVALGRWRAARTLKLAEVRDSWIVLATSSNSF